MELTFFDSHRHTHPRTHIHTRLDREKKGHEQGGKEWKLQWETGGDESETISEESFSNTWATCIKENGRGGNRGQKSEKKILVMSMSSVTSFVDLQWVSMTTVKSPLENDTLRHWGSTCLNLFIDLIWHGRCHPDVTCRSHEHTHLCQSRIDMEQITTTPFFQS